MAILETIDGRRRAIADRAGAGKNFRRGRQRSTDTRTPGYTTAKLEQVRSLPTAGRTPPGVYPSSYATSVASPRPEAQAGPGGVGAEAPGSSGTAGGGGGAATPPSSTTPSEPSAAPKQLDIEEIQAALNAISAMFDLQEGELSAEMQAAKQAFDFLRQGLVGAQERAIEQTTNQAAGRGILRSGLFLNETGRIREEVGGQINQAAAEKAARERAIQQKVAGLEAAEAAQRAQEARRLAKEQVGTKEAIARALELV